MTGPDLARRVTLRAVTPADAAFVTEVFASTREPELAALAFAPELQAAFAASQSSIQQRAYAASNPTATFDLVLVDGIPAGRLYVDRSGPGEIRLLDIALLPRFRRAGIGTHLLRELIAEASARRVAVTLHVDVGSPAQELYRRLGFAGVGAGDVHLPMRWVPPSGQPNTAS